MLASAVGPSSHGVWKTRWSFAETAANPQSLAASTAAASRCERQRLLAEAHQRQMDAELHPPILPAQVYLAGVCGLSQTEVILHRAPARETESTMSELDPAIQKLEFKVTVLPGEEPRVHDALRTAGVNPARRRVYFYDTPELELFAKDLVLRARITDGDDDDSTVKLRPLPADRRPGSLERDRRRQDRARRRGRAGRSRRPSSTESPTAARSSRSSRKR